MKNIKLKYSILCIAAFLIGVLSTLILVEKINYDEPVQKTTFTSYVIKKNTDNMEKISPGSESSKKSTQLANFFDFSNEEKPSPYNWIKEHQIHVNKKNIVIDLDNAEWAEFTDTNSMDPVIDETSHAIEIVPDSPQDIHVGDIVSYKSSFSDGTIIHRVKETGFDDQGWYAIFKGDNNKRQDPEKVRFDQIRRIVVAIIY